MGFFERLGNGWKMGMSSLGVIKKNKQLVLFPLFSGVALLAVVASFVGIIYAKWGLDFGRVVEQGSVGDYVITFLYYLICYFVIVFFNVGLVHCTRLYLKGEPMKFSDGINYSLKRIPVILGWAVLAATVGLLLKAIQENSGTLGKIVAGIIGVVWSVMTFFVVPVLAYENVGPFEAVKRSTSIMKDKWGESIGASFSFGIIGFIATLIIALPVGFLLGMINPAIGIGAGILIAFLIQCVVSSAEMVFVASVYHNVVDDMPLNDYDSELIDNLFVEKD